MTPSPTEQLTHSADQGSPDRAASQIFSPASPSLPFFCRRWVRLTLYSLFILLGVLMLVWGYLPMVTDPTFEKHIEDKRVVVGMSRQQALDAWGSPYQMNVTYTNRGIRREEWIYEDWIDPGTVRHRYLYFEEGKLVGGWYYE